MKDERLRGGSDAVWEDESARDEREDGAHVARLESRLARLHGTEDALVTATARGALALVVGHLLRPGDSLIAADQLCGASYVYLDAIAPRAGIDVRLLSAPWDAERWAEQIDERTQLVLVECPSDPNLFLPDLEALSALTGEHCVPLVVDTTLATPVFCRAADWGAALVLTDLRGGLTGRVDVAGGAVLGSRERLEALREDLARGLGAPLHPTLAREATRGLETLFARQLAARERTLAVRSHLLERRADGEVTFVDHPSLRKHPQHALARRWAGGFGANVVTFGVPGGDDAAQAFLAALRFVRHGGPAGVPRSSVVQPYRDTHGLLTTQQRKAAVIRAGMLSLRVGLEDPADLVRDLDRGFAALARGQASG